MKPSVLLFGGRSDERLVSVASAQNLARQADFSELWFVHFSGEIARVTKDELLAHKRPFEVAFQPSKPSFAPSLEKALPALKDKVVFLGFHGTEGEDGTIQELFEKNRIAYTGSDSKSSRACFNKIEAKKIVAGKLPVAPELVFDRRLARLLADFFREHGAIVVKPAESGSSVGLHIVKAAAELPAVIAAVEKSSYGSFLAEKFIEGREVTVGVIDGRGALPPSEVVVEQGHSFDYNGKYLGIGTKEVTPAELTDAERLAVQKVALDAHKILGCFGYSRTDMILTKTGPVFLETNTLPGLSAASFIPQQLQADGVSVRVFVQGQLELAEKRAEWR